MMPSSAEYMREWRRSDPERYEREKQASAARKRALERLADQYPRLLERLVDEERALVGLPPVRSTRVGRKPQKRAS